jgi:hypothetical protein
VFAQAVVIDARATAGGLAFTGGRLLTLGD